MNKQINSLLVAAVMAGASASAFAADTSVTIVARATPKLVGATPAMSYAHGMATAAAQTAGSFTFDVLDPKSNVPTAKIAGCQTTSENNNGTMKLLTHVRNGRTMTVSAGVSDTVRVSDTTRVECVIKP
jgi:hypothetical protein